MIILNAIESSLGCEIKMLQNLGIYFFRLAQSLSSISLSYF